MNETRRLERRTGTTRLRIPELLLRSDSTIQEVADRIGLTANAVRNHVSTLERAGLVRPTGRRPDTGGKPARCTASRSSRRSSFPKGYAFVLRRLIRSLEDRMGPEAVRDLLEEIRTEAPPQPHAPLAEARSG